MSPEVEHDPDRPEWTCSAGCGEWPCAPQRERWLRLYRGRHKDLGARLGMTFVQMVNDLPDEDPALLRERLFGWVQWRRKSTGPSGPMAIVFTGSEAMGNVTERRRRNRGPATGWGPF